MFFVTNFKSEYIYFNKETHDDDDDAKRKKIKSLIELFGGEYIDD